MILMALKKIYEISCTIQSTGKPYNISDEAKTIYQQEFNLDQAIIAKVGISDKEFAGVLQGYFGRLDAKRFKMALTFQIVKDACYGGSFEFVITGKSMQQAYDVISFFQGSVIWLLKEKFRFTPFKQKTKRITDILQKNDGQMNRRVLLHRTGWRAKEFQDVIQTGIESGLWIISDVKKNSGQISKMTARSFSLSANPEFFLFFLNHKNL